MGIVGGFGPISDQEDFTKVYQNARKWHCDCCVIYFLAGEEKKFAAVASKKIGKAVVRNRSKRLLRAVFSNIKDEIASGIYIIIAKQSIKDMSYNNIEKKIKWSFKKIGSIK